MKVTPINMAEAIFEPFWDPDLSGLPQWQIDDGSDRGLRVYQFWCFVSYEWTRKPERGPGLRMSRQVDVDCTGYDRLIIEVMAPERSIFRLTATTDKGPVSFVSPPAPALKREYAIDLNGATHIDTLALDVDTTDDGMATGWFNWIGLQNSTLLQRYLAQRKRFDSQWEGYIKPESYEPALSQRWVF